MFKVVKQPREYIAIKVPEDCEDIKKFVINEAEKTGIRLYVTTYYADGRRWATKVGVKSVEAQTVKRGSIIVCKISQDGSKYPESVDAMGQEEFDKKFKPVDDPVKGFSTTINVDAKPLLAKLNEIKAEMSTKIEGTELPTRHVFSESFIAGMYKALNKYQQKREQSSQRESTPHVRIEFDDVNDVPHVWIDGKQVDSPPDTALVSVDLNWHTRDQVLEHGNQNQYKIEYLDGDKRVGIAGGNVFSNELFKK